jgi:hypothetical protein
VETDPPVAVAIHSARDWPAGLPRMEAPVAVLANQVHQPINAICDIRRNPALDLLTLRPSVTEIMALPSSPPHSRPTPTAPDFSVNVSSESNSHVRGEDCDPHSAALQTSVLVVTQAPVNPDHESANQPAATDPTTDPSQEDFQQGYSDTGGPEKPKSDEHITSEDESRG